MSTLYLCLVTFFTACLFTYINLFNSEKFSNFFFLIYGSGIVIIYCIVYGLIGVGLFLILKDSGLTIGENNTIFADSYLSAFVVGLAAKGIADIKFFDIKHAGEPFPIGLKTVSHFIDTRFEKEFESICFDRFLTFITPYRVKYSNVNLEVFKKQIAEILSSHPSTEKVATFSKLVIGKTKSTKEILDGIVREFGKRTLNTINKNVSPDL